MEENAALLDAPVESGAAGGSEGGNAAPPVENNAGKGGEQQSEDLDLRSLGLDEEEGEQPKPQEQLKPEDEFKDYGNTATARLNSYIKKAPELSAVFKKYPDLRSTFEAVLRRDSGYREVFPTLAEAKQLREALPGGKADLETLMQDVNDLSALDNQYDDPGEDGSYPGHEQMVKDFFERDKAAASSLLRRIAKMWPTLDPESYRDVFSGIVASTFASYQIPKFVADLKKMAEKAGNEGLAENIGELENWINGYSTKKAEPTAQEQELARQRAQFDKDRQKDTDSKRMDFRKNVVLQSRAMQMDQIKSHPAIAKLLAAKAVSAEKKNAIVGEIWKTVVKHFANSPSFSRKFNAAHARMDIQECLNLQRAAWSEPFTFNRLVKQVLSREVPALVTPRRVAAGNAGQRRPAAPANNGGGKPDANKGLKQVGGVWYRDGKRLSTAEVLAGKHQQ